MIYVHPVPPALDVTRQIVTAYNEALKPAVQTLAEQTSYKERVYWLDFFDDLVSEDGTALKTELKFDDTHLSPTYTQYLRRALTQCHS